MELCDAVESFSGGGATRQVRPSYGVLTAAPPGKSRVQYWMLSRLIVIIS